MTVCNEKVKEAIEQELQAALDKHGPYHSDAERYAVMLEELEEAQDELVQARRELQRMWLQIRGDNPKLADECAARVGYNAEKLAREACQLAATARKAVARHG